jgi:carboxyl-terminal processing protease
MKTTRDPETNFEYLWRTFHHWYPFFALRKVDWDEQYKTFRPRVTQDTTDQELFTILCEMLAPLNDGHVDLTAKNVGNIKRRYFNPEKTAKFDQEFTAGEAKQLFRTTGATLVEHGFGKVRKTAAWMLRYCRSTDFGYLRILELEGIKGRELTAALDRIACDFKTLKGFIIDIRDNPGGDDDVVLAILDRFCDRKRVAFRRRTKIGPSEKDLTELKTWHLKPKGKFQFTGPIVLLTCDAVFSGAEVFALAARQLPQVTILGDRTNGIFSYQLEKKLPNGWKFRLSYQIYLSAKLECFEAVGVPPNIEMLNTKDDIENNVDPLIVRALEMLSTKT